MENNRFSSEIGYTAQLKSLGSAPGLLKFCSCRNCVNRESVACEPGVGRILIEDSYIGRATEESLHMLKSPHDRLL